MIISELHSRRKVVGMNQTKKAIGSGSAKKVYVANDADDTFSSQIKRMCGENSIPIDDNMTMDELGKACGIDVGCAVCALIED